MTWKITLQEHEDGALMALPEELRQKLDVEIGDWIEFEKTERGFLMKKSERAGEEGRDA